MYKEPQEHIKSLSGDDIVFVFQFPNPRDGVELTMSRLHQYMVSVASMKITYYKDEPTGTQYILTDIPV